MVNLAENLKRHRENAGLTPREMSRIANISPEYIYKIESGDITSPGFEKLQEIAKALSITVFQLLAEEGETPEQVIAQGLRPKEAMDAPSYKPHDIPVVGLAKAGRGGFFDKEGYPVDEWTKMIHRPSDIRDPHAYALTVTGNSMEPHIKKGQILLIDPSLEPNQGDYVVVQTKEGEVFVKEFHSKNDHVILKSLNESYDPFILKPKEIRAIHVVGWIKRR